jgi:hypothetical protein
MICEINRINNTIYFVKFEIWINIAEEKVGINTQQ